MWSIADKASTGIRQIELVDVSPRDGLQNEPCHVSTATKVELVQRLIAAGLRRIEVASFVNPKKVPQMADADQLLAALPRSPGVQFIGLILNRRGFDRAVGAGCHEVGMVVAASDAFNRRNQGVTTDDSVLEWLRMASAASAARVGAHVTIATAFGCPFEGEGSLAGVIELAERIAQGNPSEISFADTIGAGVPDQVTDLLHRVQERLPGMRLRCHFHNTRNTGIANSYAAIQAGASALDSSVGGVGGCPFAPGATGNVPTEDLVYLLDRSSIQTGARFDELLGTARWLEQQLGRSVPGMLVKSGPFPPAAHA